MSNRRKLKSVVALPKGIEVNLLDTQCKFFGGHVKPEDNYLCSTPGTTRTYGLVLCDLHYGTMNKHPNDWTDEELGY